MVRPIIFTVVAASLAAAPTTARALDEAATHVDSVLDRLEKRLLDQESDGLTFSERVNPKQLQNDSEPVKKFDFTKRQKISGGTAAQESLKAISNSVAELENQIDQFSANVQKTKQSILDDAHIDNFFTLEANLADTDAAAITAITVKIDGFSVYELKDAAGMWMPAKSVPLHGGPLQPGNHRVDLEARVVVKPKKALPMNGDTYRFINKTFDIVVPGGTRTTRYTISITPPDSQTGQADATIKEAT